MHDGVMTDVGRSTRRRKKKTDHLERGRPAASDVEDNPTKRIARHVPLISDVPGRTTLGFALLMSSYLVAGSLVSGGHPWAMASVAALAWMLAVLATDKYRHKYPQRYYSYLLASHLKAAVVMAMVLWVAQRITGSALVPGLTLWAGWLLFVVVDGLVSAPCRRDKRAMRKISHLLDSTPGGPVDDADAAALELCTLDKCAILTALQSVVDGPMLDFLKQALPDDNGDATGVNVLDAVPSLNDLPEAPVALLASRFRLNDVRRLNRFLLTCIEQLPMGGYYAGRYTPLEDVYGDLKHRHTGLLRRPAYLLHFAWYRVFPKIPWLNTVYFALTRGRNRVVSKTEIWGRLAYCGMSVVAEEKCNGETYLLARRIAQPVENRKPSYYSVVALEKVGLEGEIIRTHKVRTMFPFSEFIQKRLFEDNGLSSSGKFQNDFRLTEYGKFLRKYWLDEIPQIVDWLRGEIKLVGIRATSRHFLSLYAPEFLDLYYQVKPGLIPPLFDESTDGFEGIVRIEQIYLQEYLAKPLLTDVRCLTKTLVDIFVRGVRSH